TGYTLSESKPGQTGVKSRLFDVCENATRFYQEQLAGQIGKAAREYLAKRELSGLIERYRLGYSPDWGSLIAYMKTKNLDWKWNALFKGVRDEVLPESYFVHFFLSNNLPKKGVEIQNIIKDLSKASSVDYRHK
ncbi:hypothetical protein LCGC14_2878800, partial [marine sediment metagenome]